MHTQNLKKIFSVERARQGDDRYENAKAKQWISNSYKKYTQQMFY